MLIPNRFSTEEIIKAVDGILVNGDMGITFKGICTDTRIFEPGYLFWALRGKNFDGHHFWREAIHRGAKGLVLEYLPKEIKLEEFPKTISLILVKDTLRALGDLAKAYREKRGFQIIAITGSCGKTTTKELTHKILSKFYQVAKNEGNYNNLIGVPLTLLKIKEKPDWIVLELGTSLPGEIERLAEICAPKISLITCVYPAHLEGLSSLEGVLKEKLSLFLGTEREGVLIYFYDQAHLREKAKALSHPHKFSYGKEEGADLRLVKSEVKGDKTWVEIEYRGKKYNFEIECAGEHNLMNLLGAISVVLATGVPIERILENLPKDIKPLTRSKLFQRGELYIIDDSYNANPGSMEKALIWLSEQPLSFGPKIAILGDMKELGSFAEDFHRSIGELAGERVDKAIFIGEMAEFYAQGFKASGKPYTTYESVEHFLEKGFLEESKAIVLVKGSRALRMERIVEKLLEEGN